MRAGPDHRSGSLSRFRAPAPAPRRQGRRPGRARLGRDEQRRHRDPQGLGQGLQGRNRHVFPTALDPSDVGTVDAGSEGQPLLRQPLLDPQPPQVPPDDAPRVYRATEPCQRLDNRRTDNPSLRGPGIG